MDGKRDLAGENTDGTEEKGEKMDVREVVNGQDVEMKDATVAHAKDAPFPSVNGKGVNGSHNDNASVPQEPRKPVLDQPTSLVEKKTSGVTVVALVATQPPPQLARPLTPPPRALDRTAQTQINGRTEAAPVTLKAKVEMMDGVIPSGLVGADEHTLNATNDATIIEGSRMTTPASTASSTSTSAMNSRSTSIGISVSAPLHPSPAPYAHVPPLSSSIPLSRRPSHEDGEIPSSTPPKTYQPRSHTPPTQPRSFHAAHPPSPSFGPTSSSSSSSSSVPRRPAPPPLSRSPLSNAASPGPVPISSRPLPSGPRALRGSMNQPTHPPYASTRPPYVGSQYIPRGPSADRDRMDWDRDRQWTASSRSRGSNGWGR
ncbi:hypothetical protein BS17DRAFT_773244 [Gyrodon lividus]|nr:hypothetical protein BS17DRAFT_773244 [Gyrodon lividus]